MEAIKFWQSVNYIFFWGNHRSHDPWGPQTVVQCCTTPWPMEGVHCCTTLYNPMTHGEGALLYNVVQPHDPWRGCTLVQCCTTPSPMEGVSRCTMLYNPITHGEGGSLYNVLQPHDSWGFVPIVQHCCHGHGNFQDDFLWTFSFLHVHAPYHPFRLLMNLGKTLKQDKRWHSYGR